jgi:hypothetical protein
MFLHLTLASLFCCVTATLTQKFARIDYLTPHQVQMSRNILHTSYKPFPFENYVKMYILCEKVTTLVPIFGENIGYFIENQCYFLPKIAVF